MAPLRLAGSSKPGLRKYILLYLVDPHIKILSTANVPPQQKEWWKAELLDENSRFGKLPTETFEQIISSVEDFPISKQEGDVLATDMEVERKTL